MTQEKNTFDLAEDALAHYGVKGMKWGRRKRDKRTPSEDHTTARQLSKKKPEELSNVELKKLNERLQLERTYKDLQGKNAKEKRDKGQKAVNDVMKYAKQGQEIYNFVNSPAGKAVRSVIEEQLKAARR